MTDLKKIAERNPTTERRRTSGCVAYIVVLATGVVLSCWLGYAGYPVPRADDDFYKSPAAELAANGRLTIPCVRGFLPQAENVFASYPQGYQVILSAWYLVFGFSLTSSLAYSFTIHLINALLISLVTARLLQDNCDLSRISANCIIAATGWIHIANIAYFDRPEETALILIWLEVLLAWHSPNGTIFLRSFVSGLLLGSAALIAPWVGVLGALVVVFRSFFSALQSQGAGLKNWKTALLGLGVTGGTAAVIAIVWYLVMNRLYPGMVQAQMSVVFGFMKENQMRSLFFGNLALFLRTLFFNPNQILVTALVLVFFPFFIVSRGWRQTNPLSMALYCAAILSILFCGLTRPAVYTYVGASQMILLPCFGPAFSRFIPCTDQVVRTRMGHAVLGLCILYTYGDVARLSYRSLQLPAAERPQAVFARLREIVPADASVAVTSRHWYAFQGRNRWLDAYWCSLTDPPETLNCQWMVLYRGKGTPDFIDSFELIEELPTQAQSDETYAFLIYRRKRRVR